MQFLLRSTRAALPCYHSSGNNSKAAAGPCERLSHPLTSTCCLLPPSDSQYLTCALRESGKRQLDCLGMATAVLALCHDIAAQDAQHAQLSGARLMLSDDHCWIAVAAEDGEDRHVEVTDSR